MSKLRKVVLVSAVIYVPVPAIAQFNYSGRVEVGYHIFVSRPIRVDPGPNWRGYQLDKEPSGLELNFVNGISFKNHITAGVGVGYLNYEGIHGYAVFGDFEYAGPKAKFAPLINLKVGRSHINNQYENGSTDAFADISGGIEYKATKKLRLQLKAGFRMVHQTVFLPIRIGTRF